MTNPESNTDNSVRLLVAWAFVGIPLAWGVAQVVVRSLALFK